MSRLTWDDAGERLYETGLDQGVLYPYADGTPGAGVAWNGLTALTQSPDGAEPTAVYADNIKYVTLRSVENFKGTIEALMYPDEWAECDGSVEPVTGLRIGQQSRKIFGLSYRTKIGNDDDFDDHGYKIHMVYGATASPSEQAYKTINDSPETNTMSWEFETTPVTVTGYKPTAHLEVDSTKVTAAKLAALEEALYGIDTASISEFSSTSTYAVGARCKKTESSTTTYYQCITAISTAGAWDATKWRVMDQTGPRLPMPSEVITILT